MSFDLDLPETAKALAEPLKKLIEVVAAGCGRVYEPTGIRRKARAEAEATVLREVAKANASEFARRAVERVIDIEERRQRNIEAIASEAARVLPEKVNSDPVDPDWTVRFFAECQDVGNDQMQSVWARLLAGEVAHPGSFSQRTLSVVKNLRPKEAQHFNLLVKNSFIVQESAYCPFVGIGSRERANFWDSCDMSLTAFYRLTEAGLINYQPLGFALKGKVITLLTHEKIYSVTAGEASEFNLGSVEFSAAGMELARICEWSINPQRESEIIKSIGAPFVAEDYTEGFGRQFNDPEFLRSYLRDVRNCTWLDGNYETGIGPEPPLVVRGTRDSGKAAGRWGR